MYKSFALATQQSNADDNKRVPLLWHLFYVHMLTHIERQGKTLSPYMRLFLLDSAETLKYFITQSLVEVVSLTDKFEFP